MVLILDNRSAKITDISKSFLDYYLISIILSQPILKMSKNTKIKNMKNTFLPNFGKFTSIKSDKQINYTEIKSIPKYIVLSGTPIYNDPYETMNIINLLGPNSLSIFYKKDNSFGKQEEL